LVTPGGVENGNLESDTEPPVSFITPCKPDSGVCPKGTDGGGVVTDDGVSQLIAPRTCQPVPDLGQNGTLFSYFVRWDTDSPFFPHTVWFRSPYIAISEGAFRTAGPTVGVGHWPGMSRLAF